jgi:16S rRNA (guanine(1405)-N(7))-methyltransferase
MMSDSQLEQLVLQVQSNRKYKAITPNLVRRLSKTALSKGLTGKAAVKDVRNKLHQIGGAYFKKPVDYDNLLEKLSELPKELFSEKVMNFCLSQMKAHASTAERLPIIEQFFNTCLEPIGPVESILDLACGMNPLAIPWMPLKPGFVYHACDIYTDLLEFLHAFFANYEIAGTAETCDLIGDVPQPKAQLAFLLKSIPCLEQVDKNIGLMLMERIRADHILVSFPVQSLGGHNKGMPDFYEQHFYEMISGKPWQIERFLFETELAFLVSK